MRTFVTLIMLLFCSTPLHADVTFVFDYSQSAEFLNSQTRRLALEDAAQTVGSWFDHEATIVMRVVSQNTTGSMLASAGSEILVPPDSFPGGFWPGVIMHKIQTGEDQNGLVQDGTIAVNVAGVDWDYDDDIDPGKQDFKSTIMHELIHAMGFISGIDQDGQDFFGTPVGDPGTWEPFDEFLVGTNFLRVINIDHRINTRVYTNGVTGGASPSNGLFFAGPRSVLANGGDPVGLFTPNVFEPTSSVAHLDDENPAYDGLLLRAGTSPGPGPRRLSNLETAILEDLGYELNAEITFHVQNLVIDPPSIRLSVKAREGQAFEVQQSTSLDGTWLTLPASFQGAAGDVEITLPLGSRQQLFYRGRIP